MNEDRTNLSPLERGLSLSLGVVAAAAALKRQRIVPASLLATAAGFLIYRGISGRSNLYRWLGVSGSEVGETIGASSQITVQLEPATVHRRVRDLTGFPLFSSYLENAEKLGDDRCRVRLRAPNGGDRRLEVRRTADEEGRRLAWATVGESPFPAALEFRFLGVRTGTEIHADLWFVPPGPKVVSRALASAERSRLLNRAGLSPSQLLEQELRRLRQLLEAGETATVKGQSAGGKRARRVGTKQPALVAEQG